MNNKKTVPVNVVWPWETRKIAKIIAKAKKARVAS